MYKKISRIYKIFIMIIFVAVILSNKIIVYADDELEIDAKAALVVENNSGKIIYEDEAKEQNYPASVTKILTAIIVLENCKLDDTATVSSSAISKVPEGYVVAPLFVGEKMKINDLLYALMLKSANDAAYVLAEHVGGSIDGFSDLMNKKAKEIGCENTHFVNPNGIHNEEHYTTAYDMYLISKYAMQNEEFRKIVSTYQYTLPVTNKYSNKDRVMKNTNDFVNPNSKYYNEDVNGIKTGTTLQAGNCLITSATKEGLDIITVILGAKTSDSKFSETKKMIDYTFDNYKYSKLHKKEDIIKNIKVEKATKETEDLNLIIDTDIEVLHNTKIDLDEIKPEIKLNDKIEAPIIKGQELGTVKYTVDGLEYNAKLLAENDVEKKTYVIEILIGSGILLIIVCIVLKIRKKKSKRYSRR